MRRRIFSFAPVLSLLLCLSTVVLWGVSALGGVSFGNADGWGSVDVHGSYFNYSYLVRDSRGWPGSSVWNSSPFPGLHFQAIDISDLRRRLGTLKSVSVSVHIVLVVTAVPLALWTLSALRRRDRNAMPICISCGYDLTGNTSGTCPECSTAIRQTSRPA